MAQRSRNARRSSSAWRFACSAMERERVNGSPEPNDLFDGEAPLLVARASVAGCARVCQALESLVED